VERAKHGIALQDAVHVMNAWHTRWQQSLPESAYGDMLQHATAATIVLQT
jgi:hypothetical protein